MPVTKPSLPSRRAAIHPFESAPIPHPAAWGRPRCGSHTQIGLAPAHAVEVDPDMRESHGMQRLTNPSSLISPGDADAQLR